MNRRNTSIVFKEGELFWDEITTLVEGALLKYRHWATTGGVGLTNPIRFDGNYCKQLTLVNSERWKGHIHIRTKMTECGFRESAIGLQQHDLLFVKHLGQLILGHTIETVLPAIRKKYGLTLRGKKENYQHWPPFLDFCRHIRNGVFHGNRFAIQGRPWEGRTWRGLSITTDSHEKPVVGQQDGGFGVADVIALVYDLRKELIERGIVPLESQTTPSQTPDCRTSEFGSFR